jgi:hypothetical protein
VRSRSVGTFGISARPGRLLNDRSSNLAEDPDWIGTQGPDDQQKLDQIDLPHSGFIRGHHGLRLTEPPRQSTVVLGYLRETPAALARAKGEKRGSILRSLASRSTKAELNLGLCARLPMPSGRQLAIPGWSHVRKHPPASLTTVWILGSAFDPVKDFLSQ